MRLKILVFAVFLMTVAQPNFAQANFHKKLPRGVPKLKLCGKLEGRVATETAEIFYELYQNSMLSRNCNVIRYRAMTSISTNDEVTIAALQWEPEKLQWTPPGIGKIPRRFALEKMRGPARLWLQKRLRWREIKATSRKYVREGRMVRAIQRNLVGSSPES